MVSAERLQAKGRNYLFDLISDQRAAEISGFALLGQQKELWGDDT
jgi:hypothetical protein